MVEVGSGTAKPLADTFPSLPLSISGEIWSADGNASGNNWVSQYLEEEEVHFGAGLDLASLLSSFGAENIAVDEENHVELEPERPAPLSTPASPVSSDSSCQHSRNLVPRHKRPSHKRAEIKRRGKIKTKLDDVKAEVPKIADKEKLSESIILTEAAEFTKHLKAQCEENRTEAGNLRQEIESLSAEIHKFQEKLPAAGLNPEAKQGHGSLDQMYKDFVASQTRKNWKFFIFSFFLRPLFQSYKDKVNTDTQKTFMQSVADWSRQNLCLSNLRHLILNKMRDITRETDIMSHPESLPQQAMASIVLGNQCDDSQRSSATTPPSPQTAEQPSTGTSPVTRPALTSTSPVTGPALTSTSPATGPALTSTSPVTGPALTRTSPVTRPALTSTSPVTGPALISTSLVARPGLISTVQVTKPALTATSLAQPTLQPATGNRSGMRQVAKARSPKSRVNPMKRVVSLIPASGQQPRETMSISQAQTLFPVITSPACRQHAAGGLRILARNIGSAETLTSTSQQQVSNPSISQAIAGFPQMAISGLTMSRPTAVVAPCPPISSVAHFITDFDCLKYDFDITDIPIPDLSDVAQPTSHEPVGTSSSLLSVSVATIHQSANNPSLAQSPCVSLTQCHSSHSALASLLAQPAGSIVFPSSSSAHRS